MLRILLFLALGLAALWSGYWVVGSQAALRGMAEAIRTLDAGPATEARAEVAVQGFPNRFDLTLTEPRLRDLDSGLGWEAPFLQILALSYRPNHLIAVWPDSQRIDTPAGAIDITSSDMRGSLVLRPGAALPLDRIAWVASDLALTTPEGRVEVGAARIATRRSDETGLRHDVGIDLSSILPDGRWLTRLPDDTPATIEGVLADLVLGFDRAPAVLGDGPAPAVQSVEIRDLDLEWGPMQLALSGRIDLDTAGVASGRLTVRATGWRQMLELVTEAGAMSAGQAQMLAAGLQTLDRDGVVEAPLDLRDGTIRFAGLPVGRISAPR